jgi:hypothetical protein
MFKRRSFCLNFCYSRPGLPSITSSFKKYDRTATAFLYGIMAYQVMSIINSSLNNTTPVEISDVAQQDLTGLFKLFIQIFQVLIIGIRYYPVLVGLSTNSIFVIISSAIYSWIDLGVDIFMQGKLVFKSK